MAGSPMKHLENHSLLGLATVTQFVTGYRVGLADGMMVLCGFVNTDVHLSSHLFAKPQINTDVNIRIFVSIFTSIFTSISYYIPSIESMNRCISVIREAKLFLGLGSTNQSVHPMV